MANQNSSGLVVLTSVLGAALVGTVVYLLVKKSSASTDATTAIANVQAAKNNLANLKANPNASASQVNAANAALQAAQAALKKLQSQSKASGSGGSGGGSGAGGGSSRGSGSRPASEQLIPVNPNGDYMEKSDPTTLYNSDGSVKGDLDTNSGMFIDKNGNIVAAGDGSSVVNSDPATGAYQEADGTWYLNDGTALNNYDPTKGTYTEPDGSVYDMAGNYLGDAGVFTENSSPTVTSDGTPIMNYDTSTGNYQEPDGTWYTNDGTPIDGVGFDGAGTKHFAGFVGAGTLFK